MFILLHPINRGNEVKNPKLLAALAHAKEGIRIHPGHGVIDGVCECVDGTACPWPGKHARLKGYPRLATTDSECLKQWWERWPNSNPLGVIPDGMAEVDVDLHNPDTANGLQTLAVYERKNGRIPASVTIWTPSGGCRIRLRLPDGVTIPQKTQIGPGLELLGPGHNVVLVGATGAKGIPYEYAPRKSPAECKVAYIPNWLLEHTLAPQKTQQRGEKKKKLVLPFRIEKGQRNDLLFKKACAERAGGADFEQILDILKHEHQLRCYPRLENPERELRKIAQSAARYPTGRNVEKIRTHIADLLSRARSHPEEWRGRKGKSEFSVLLTFLRLADQAGTFTLTVSIRQAAEEAGLSDRTAYLSIQALLARGWLKLAKRFYADRPNTYTLVACDRACDTTNTVQSPASAASPTGGVELLCQQCRMSADLFRWRGLGKSSALVLSALSEKAASARDIASTLGMSKRTGERCLKRLHAHNLAVRTPAGWIRGSADLDDVARQLGVAGSGAQQRHQHEKERDDYHKQLNRRTRRAVKLIPKPDVPVDVGASTPAVQEGRRGEESAATLPLHEAHPLHDMHIPQKPTSVGAIVVDETPQPSWWEPEFRQAASWKPRRTTEARL